MDCEQEMALRMRELLPTDEDKIMFLNVMLPLLTVQTTYLCHLYNTGTQLPKGIEEAVGLGICNIAAFAHNHRDWILKVPSASMDEYEETEWSVTLKQALERILCKLYEEDVV